MEKTLFSGILLVAVFAACTKNTDILISFNNQTEKTIHSIVVDDDYILGTFKRGEKTKYIPFETFGIDGIQPDTNFTGTIDGKVLACTNRFYDCGTSKSTLEAGTYNVNIRIVSIDNEDYFDLYFEN